MNKRPDDIFRADSDDVFCGVPPITERLSSYRFRWRTLKQVISAKGGGRLAPPYACLLMAGPVIAVGEPIRLRSGET